MCKCEMAARLVVEKDRCLVVRFERPVRKQELGTFGQFVEIMCPGLQFRHSANEKRKFLVAQPEPGRNEGRKAGILSFPNIVAVEVFEFFQVEPRRALADVIDVEPFDRLIAADDLIVSMAPAEPE